MNLGHEMKSSDFSFYFQYCADRMSWNTGIEDALKSLNFPYYSNFIYNFRVKFGVPINEAFAHDIPATLLVLLLKVNKEGPLKKDIWRAPGNQAQVRKLSHIMVSHFLRIK